MWKCANCGEDENEDSFNFCSTCGTPKHERALAPREEIDVKTAFTAFSNDAPKQNGEHHAGEHAGEPQKWHRPHPLRAIGQRFKGALSNGHLNHVKVSSDAQDKLATLVHAGVFSSKAEAAAYLIERGIRAETKLFDIVRQKLTEIERIELELRNLVSKTMRNDE